MDQITAQHQFQLINKQLIEKNRMKFNNQYNYFKHQGVTTRAQSNFFNNKANLIKRCFKNFANSQSMPQLNIVDFSTKKIIEKEMRQLHEMITSSNSAIIVNMKASDNNDYMWQFDYTPYSLCCLEHKIFDQEKTPQKSDVIYLLKEFIKKKNMICDEFALYMAIALNSNPNIPSFLKDQIFVCKVHGHTMCCIFKPVPENDNKCIVIDPWIFYLDLKAHPDYRPQQVLPIQNRTRGFIGNLLDYKIFLTNHPNKYIPENLEMEFKINVGISKIAKKINLTEIIS
jgi:hypothetical protein